MQKLIHKAYKVYEADIERFLQELFPRFNLADIIRDVIINPQDIERLKKDIKYNAVELNHEKDPEELRLIIADLLIASIKMHYLQLYGKVRSKAQPFGDVVIMLWCHAINQKIAG